jgi:hypothetical protein
MAMFGGFMNGIPEALPYIQNFFQMNFLFSGLEVSSTMILAARVLMVVVLGGSLLWAMFKIIIKLLDCIQTFLANLGQIPWVFYLLPLLVIPSSADSLAAKWIGYVLLLMALLGFSFLGLLALVLWKYGVDQALRLINRLSHPRSNLSPQYSRESSMPPDNIVGRFADSPQSVKG